MPVQLVLQLLRQNLRFKKLDLSKCFLSDKNFLALTQALAWNCRVEEVGADAYYSGFNIDEQGGSFRIQVQKQFRVNKDILRSCCCTKETLKNHPLCGQMS